MKLKIHGLTDLEEKLCNLLLEYLELTQSEIRKRLESSRSKVQRMISEIPKSLILPGF